MAFAQVDDIACKSKAAKAEEARVAQY